jgi:hypothetical protein
MNTLKSTGSRALLLASVLAAFAVRAESSPAVHDVDATQSRVRSVLEGTRSENNFTSSSVAADRAADIQEGIRQVLLGDNGSRSNAASSVTASVGTQTGGNGQGSDATQRLTQRLVLGRAAP